MAKIVMATNERKNAGFFCVAILKSNEMKMQNENEIKIVTDSSKNENQENEIALKLDCD